LADRYPFGRQHDANRDTLCFVVMGSVQPVSSATPFPSQLPMRQFGRRPCVTKDAPVGWLTHAAVQAALGCDASL